MAGGRMCLGTLCGSMTMEHAGAGASRRLLVFSVVKFPRLFETVSDM